MNTAFDSFTDVLKNMSFSEKQALISAHQNYSRLKSLCLAHGEIEMLPGFSGFRVLKKTKDVAELKKVVEKLQPGHFKWEEGKKKTAT